MQSLGETPETEEPFRVDVVLDKTAKTITIEDNGIGMTEEELKKYICSIALSGAVDFIQKYESSEDGEKSGIIGHFGLGFYSAFMVSDRVEIFTRSYSGAPAVHWTCDGDGAYELEAGEREGRGTEVVLHIADDETEYLESGKIREMLRKYCSFMPVEIYFDDGSEKKEGEKEEPVNDTTPLWQKNPADCTDEEYKDFYQKVFADYREPLFWIHINADYPLNFKGILYFPRLATNYDSLEGQVKLYYNQVFVADNIKEVIPEYLLMLKGVLDCPELPLNVSRSYLQTNTYVAKVSAHIVKKVADKLKSLCRDERERYEKVFDDIKTFVEYACIRDGKFYDRVKESLLLKLTDGTHVTIDEYLDKAKETHENKIYYTTDPSVQAQYIALYRAEGIDVAHFDSLVDTQFAACVESHREGVKFIRVDADLSSLSKGENAEENETLRTLFRKVSGNEKLNVKFEALKNAAIPAVLNVSEESRRMEDMMKMYRMSGGADFGESFPLDMTLVLNTASPLISKLAAMDGSDAEGAENYASYIYRLSLLSLRKFTSEEMEKFLKDSYKMLDELMK